MKSTLKYILAFLLLLLIIATGYIREYVFVNINFELIDIYYKRNDWQLKGLLSIFENWEYAKLYYFKFWLTGFFTLIYCLLCCLGIYLLFRNKNYLKITIGAFVFILLITAIFYGYGYFFNDFKNGYKFSRIMMDFIESPKIFMILVPGFILFELQKQHLPH